MTEKQYDTVLDVTTIAIWFLVVCMFFFVSVSAVAQHRHDAGHNQYHGWTSGKTGNCCNNLDCGALKSHEVRETNSGDEVLIADVWCPVKPEHYIRTGKSPDWTVAHACIRRTLETPCDRLLCFVAEPRF